MLLVKLELKLGKVQLLIVRTSSPTCTKPNVGCSTLSSNYNNFEMSKIKNKSKKTKITMVFINNLVVQMAYELSMQKGYKWPKKMSKNFVKLMEHTHK
jgi:hypothetical protein